jgi:hypothetical protein
MDLKMTQKDGCRHKYYSKLVYVFLNIFTLLNSDPFTFESIKPSFGRSLKQEMQVYHTISACGDLRDSNAMYRLQMKCE